jgi:hypothetical protein
MPTPKRSEKGGNNITVAEAVTEYQTDLTARSRSSDSKYNVTVTRSPVLAEEVLVIECS